MILMELRALLLSKRIADVDAEYGHRNGEETIAELDLVFDDGTRLCIGATYDVDRDHSLTFHQETPE